MPLPPGRTQMLVPGDCTFAKAYVTGVYGPPAPGNRYVCTLQTRIQPPLIFGLVREVPLMAGTYLVQTVHNRSQNQDVAVTTSHWRWSPGEDPVETDFEIVEDRLEGFWTALQSWRSSVAVSGEFRWYGPFDAPGPMGEAIRVTPAPAVKGTAATGLPQQVACSVTLVTDVRRRWGRFYIPTISGAVGATGPLQNAPWGLFAVAGVGNFGGAVADAAAAAFIQSNPNWRLVVFGAPTPTSLEVREIRVDNVPDVIRRRRWDGSTILTRDISDPG